MLDYRIDSIGGSGHRCNGLEVLAVFAGRYALPRIPAPAQLSAPWSYRRVVLGTSFHRLAPLWEPGCINRWLDLQHTCRPPGAILDNLGGIPAVADHLRRNAWATK